ncbi:MAG TPA: PQQ-dependent sugar dehydrogenase [Gaiellaceae bacterium]|nr:PQQ-dependent sugar dehydrogenase [Gaiellaceae bacterium]
MRRLGVSGMLLVVAACMLPSTASALRLKRVAGGFVSPVHVASNARDPAGTLFVVEQEGRIWRVRSGRKTLFLDIRGLVSSGGERGLFSVAFPPGYERTRRFYVNYTDTGGDVRVARFRANSSFTRGVHRSRRMLLDVEHSSESNHNGGLVSFGPNGRLYVSIGDGGGGCDPAENAQNLSSRKGKLLSIDAGNLRAGWRIDGYGLRNPWRYSFDRATGRLHLADVGQGTWEELNALRPSRLGGTPENYLWDRYEGRQRNTCDPGPLRGPGRHIFPVHVYDHSHGRCSITGGHVYRGRDLARRLRGWYFYGDFCSGEIWRLRFEDGRVAARRRVADTDLNIPSFGEGKLGSLYVVARGGSVYRLVRS